MHRYLLPLLGIVSVSLIAIFLVRKTNPDFSQYQYYSVQRRASGDGRVYENIVKNRDGMWTKSATLYRGDGAILAKEERPVDPEHCRAIQNGKFVRSLWADCGPAWAK